MDLNHLKKEALRIAINKGWNDKGSSKHYICLVISELMEAVEADRKGKHANLGMFYTYINPNLCKEARFNSEILRKEVYMYGFKTYIKDTVEDELADACIRLLHLAGLLEVWGVKSGDINLFPMINRYDYNTFTEWVYLVVRDLIMMEDNTVRYGLSHILNYCFNNNIDLERHIIEKMKYNELRDFNKAY